MHTIIFIFLLVVRASTTTTTTTKPNIVFVLADDFGHANIGYHRRNENGTAKYEIHTPNLDSLADDGVILTNHYAYKICSPSRSSLQSGRLAVHVNTVNTGVTVANPNDPVSGFAGIPRNMTCMANKLKLAGYDTHAVGKWDCGCAIVESTPLGRGYDDWIGYYQHANAYYKKDATIQSVGEIDNCMNKFRDFSLLNETYRGGVPYEHELDPNTYEEDVFKAHALSLIEKKENSTVPFFLFYAFHLVRVVFETLYHSLVTVSLEYYESFLLVSYSLISFESYEHRYTHHFKYLKIIWIVLIRSRRNLLILKIEDFTLRWCCTWTKLWESW